MQLGEAFIQLTLALSPDATRKAASDGKTAGTAAGKAMSDGINSSVKVDLGAALRDVAAQAMKSGQDSGKAFGDSFNRSTKDTTGNTKIGPDDGNTTRQGAQTGGKFSDAFKRAVDSALKSLPTPEIGVSTTHAEQKIRDLRADLEQLSRKEVGLDIDDSSALAKIQEIQGELNRLGAESASIAVKVDTGAASAALDKLNEDIGRIKDVEIKAKVDDSQAADSAGKFAETFKRTVEASLAQLPSPKIDADASPADRKIDELRTKLADLANKTVGVDLDATEAKAQIESIKGELDRLGADSANIQVKVDTAAAFVKLAALDEELKKIDGKKVEAKADIDNSQILSKLKDINGAVGGTSDKFTGLGSTIAALAPLAAPLGAVIVGAMGAAAGSVASLTAGLGALKLAFLGVGDASKALQAADQQAQANAEAQQAANLQVTQAIKGVKAAEQDLQRAREAGAQSIKDAQRSVSDAVGAVGQVEKQAARDAIQAAKDVVSAKQNVKDVTTQVAQEEKDAAQAVADAEDRYRQTLKQTAEDAKAAAKGIVDAQDNLKQVIIDNAQREKDAQESVIKSQQDLVRAQQDVARAAEDAAKAVVDAQHGVKDAQQQAADDAVANAQRIKDAEQNVSDARRAAAEQAKQSAKSIADAQQGVIDAEQRAAQQSVEAAQKVKDAQQGVVDARRQAAEAAQSASQRVQSAEQELASAQRASKDAQQSLTEARKDYARQMRDLSQSVKQNALSQKEALNGITLAEQNLAKVRADPKATQAEKEQAALAVQQQRLDYEDLLNRGKDLADQREKNARTITSAQERVTTSVQGIAKAEDNLKAAHQAQADTTIANNEKIQKAQQTLSQADADQAKTSVDNARSIKDAQDKVSTARDNAAQAAEASNRRIDQADRGLSTAQQAAAKQRKDDQDRIIEAIAKVVKAQEDQQRTTEDNARKIQDAEERVSKSREQQTRTLQDDSKKVRDAQDGITQARQHSADVAEQNAERIHSAQEAVTRSQENQTRVQQEGSKKVRDANDAVTKAIQHQSDVADQNGQRIAAAQERVQKARENLAKAEKTNSQNIADAQGKVKDAEDNLARARQHASQVGIDAANKLKQALEGIGQAQIDFAKFWNNFTQTVQKQTSNAVGSELLPVISAGLSKTVLDAAGNVKSGLIKFLQDTGKALGNVAHQAFEALDSPEFKQFGNMLKKETGPNIESLGGSALIALKGVAALITAFEPLQGPLRGYIRELATSFDNWAKNLKTDPKFQQFLKYIQDNGPKIIDIFKNIATFVGHLIEGLGGEKGASMIDNLDKFTKMLANLSPAQTKAIADAIVLFFAAFKAVNAVSGAVSFIGGVADNFGKLGKALGKFKTKPAVDELEKLKGPGKGAEDAIKGVGKEAEVTAGKSGFLSKAFSGAGGLIPMMGDIPPQALLVIGAVAAIGFGLYELYKHNPKFKKFVDDTFGHLKEAAGKAKDWFTGTFVPDFKRGWDQFSQDAKPAVDGVKSALSGLNYFMTNTVEPQLKDAWDKIVAAFKSPAGQQALKDYAGYVRGMVTDVSGLIKTLGDAVGGGLKTISDLLNGDYGKAWDHYKETVHKVWDDLKSTSEKSSNAIKDTSLGKLTEKLKGDASTAWDNFKKKVTDTWNSITGTISDAWGKVKAKLDEGKTFITNTFGPSFTGLRDNFVKPAFENIKVIIQDVWAVIHVIFNTFILVMELIGKGATALYEKYIKPAWDHIKTWVTDKWKAIKKDVFDAWTTATDAIQKKWDQFTKWLSESWDKMTASLKKHWEDIKKNVFEAWQNYVSGPFTKAWNTFSAWFDKEWTKLKNTLTKHWDDIKKDVFDAWTKYVSGPFEKAWNTFKEWFGKLWDSIKKKLDTVWQDIKNSVLGKMISYLGKEVKNAWENAKTHIVNAWDAIKKPITNTWNDVKKNVLTPMMNFVTKDVPAAFDKAVKAVAKVWGKISDAVKNPVKTFTDKVINGLIIKGFDAIADKVDKSLHINPVDTSKLATGGIMPGYTPGRDVHQFFSPTGGALELSGGEAVMRPEWTRAVGPGFVNKMNSAARTGGVSGVRDALGLASGGIIPGKLASGGIIGTLSSWWEALKDMTKSAGHVVEDITQPIASIPTNMPYLKDMFKDIAKTLINGVKHSVEDLFTAGRGSAPSTGVIGNPKALKISDGVGYQWQEQVLNTSGIPHSISSTTGGSHATDSWHYRGRAVDIIPPSMAMFNWIKSHYGATTKELIYSPAVTGIKNGKPVNIRSFYGEDVYKGHFNHVHWAYKDGGMIPTYDDGGWLAPNSIGVNRGKQPEAVLTPDESRGLKNMGTGELIDKLDELIEAVERVAPGVGGYIRGSGTGLVTKGRSV